MNLSPRGVSEAGWAAGEFRDDVWKGGISIVLSLALGPDTSSAHASLADHFAVCQSGIGNAYLGQTEAPMGCPGVLAPGTGRLGGWHGEEDISAKYVGDGQGYRTVLGIN
jgi:hypothetical protein